MFDYMENTSSLWLVIFFFFSSVLPLSFIHYLMACYKCAFLLTRVEWDSYTSLNGVLCKSYWYLLVYTWKCPLLTSSLLNLPCITICSYCIRSMEIVNLVSFSFLLKVIMMWNNTLLLNIRQFRCCWRS